MVSRIMGSVRSNMSTTATSGNSARSMSSAREDQMPNRVFVRWSSPAHRKRLYPAGGKGEGYAQRNRVYGGLYATVLSHTTRGVFHFARGLSDAGQRRRKVPSVSRTMCTYSSVVVNICGYSGVWP